MVETAKPDLKKTIGYSLGCLWLFLGLQVALSGSLGTLAGMILSAFEDSMSYGEYMTVNSLCNSLILLAATGVSGMVTIMAGSRMFGSHPFEQLTKARMSWSWTGKGVCMSYAASVALGLIVSVLNLFLGYLFGVQAQSPEITQTGWLDGLINFVSVVLLAPVFEELVFRGLICRGLAKYNAGFAVVFSALLFSLAHLSLGQSIPVFGMGIVFGYLYYRSGSIKVPVVVHMVNNLVATLIGYLHSDLFVSLAGMAVLALAIIGLVLIVRERDQFGGMLALCGRAREEWMAASHKISFWILVGLFVLFSIGDLVLSAL